jgi:hypothetical protein
MDIENSALLFGVSPLLALHGQASALAQFGMMGVSPHDRKYGFARTRSTGIIKAKHLSRAPEK